MRQYLDIKDKHPDAVLFFRLGDFYEMFFEDAVLGARLLDLTLTTRDKGRDDAVPMCGVPHHAARGYIARLTELGHKVVLCEQVEDPKLAKGLVKREVVRIITPGIVLDDDVLDPKVPRYVVALALTPREARGTSAKIGASSKIGTSKPAAKIARPAAPAFALGTLDGVNPSERAPVDRARAEVCGLAYLDVTTGELGATELPLAAVVDELVRIAPREVVCSPELLAERSRLAPIRARYKLPWNAASLPDDDPRAVLGPLWTAVFEEGARARSGIEERGVGKGAGEGARARSVTHVDLTEHPLAARAAAFVVAYARSTQPTGALPIARLRLYAPGDTVVLDEAAIANLELVETLIGKHKQGSLLEVIDETATAPGGRMLRRWLLYPLVDVAAIRRRQDAVAWLVERPSLCETVQRTLARIADLERLAGKATLGVATPRDIGRLRDALAQLPGLIELVRSGHDAFSAIGWGGAPGASGTATDEAVELSPLPGLLDLEACAHGTLPALAARLASSLVDEPPSLLKDGGVIRAGYDAGVDDCRRLADGGKEEILTIEEREQKRSGIPSLKVRYNRVFGYYIEITKTHLARVPDDYIRKQTIANGERYVTTELAELERRVIAAEETLAAREAELFRAEIAAVVACAREVASAGAAIAVLDACTSLAQVAATRGYCRPQVVDGTRLEIIDGRHPVIEAMLPTHTFVPNDCTLDPDDPDDAAQLVLITGPNMAGKSTYIRQVAQIVLLAQIGSFVPAKSATIGICDRVFTRVGAADNLSRGDSTFMVEMRETASILAKATARSLVVLDEVGRGTSTFDGVSIAWAVCEHLHDAIGARTLFATHYHELVALAETRPRIRNVSVAVREHAGEIVFLRRVVPGGANKSYGIDVARLAGLPGSVIARSREIMRQLEGGSLDGRSAQLSLMSRAAPSPSPITTRLVAIDLDRTTPLEALQLLAELKRELSRTS